MPIVPDTPPGNLTIGMTGFNERAAEQIAFINNLMTLLNQASGFLTGDDRQSSATDTTADALMKVGAFGWGSTLISLLEDANSALGAGTQFYRGYNGTNYPDGSTDGYVLLHIDRSDGAAFQVAYNVTDGDQYTRSYTASAWSAWDKTLKASAVQSSVTDETAGKLMQVGAFGWGLTSGAANIADWDDHTIASGMYLFSITTANLGSKPPLYADGNFGFARVERYNESYMTVTVWRATGDALPYTRRYINGTWGTWTRLFTGESIKGTVSQVGGLPTGALVERVSNANGEAFKFACGTLICWKRITLTAQNISTAYGSGGLFRSENVLSGANAYPASFIVAPACVVSCAVDDYSILTAVGGTGDGNNTPATAYAVSPVSLTSRNIRVSVEAIGRWY